MTRSCEPGHHNWNRLHRARVLPGHSIEHAYVYECEKCGKREINP